jgi:hypothetical protein
MEDHSKIGQKQEEWKFSFEGSQSELSFSLRFLVSLDNQNREGSEDPKSVFKIIEFWKDEILKTWIIKSLRKKSLEKYPFNFWNQFLFSILFNSNKLVSNNWFLVSSLLNLELFEKCEWFIRFVQKEITDLN